jgi:hypothetical protein
MNALNVKDVYFYVAQNVLIFFLDDETNCPMCRF